MHSMESSAGHREITAMASNHRRLDLRYATDAEEDAAEIAALVNSVYSIEEEEYSGAPEVSDPIVFRTSGNKVSVSEVENEIQRPGAARWVVLETPAPEEATVAAARVWISPQENKATIDIFAVASNDDRVQFLVRIESLVRSLGIGRLVFRCPHWRGDVQEWLEASGYSDRGGFAWPEELRHQVLRHTMILEYEREVLQSRREQSDREAEQVNSFHPTAYSADADVEGDFLDEIGGDGIHIEEIPGGSSASLEATIVDLFAALHRETSLNPDP